MAFGDTFPPSPNFPFDQQVQWPTVGGQQGALLNPFSGVPDPANPNVLWRQTLVSEPYPWLPYSKQNDIGFFCRWYVVPTVNNETANTEVVRSLLVDVPGFIYEITGAAADTTGAALPVGLDSRDTFLVRIDHNQGDKLVTSAALGSAVVGDAKFPAKIGLSGWKFNRGSTAFFGITPRRANLRVDVLVKFIEIRAGANFGSLG